MFFTISKALKIGGFRIGAGFHVNKSNACWMWIILMFIFMFQLIWYLMILMVWMLYALFYSMWWCTKKVYQGLKMVYSNKEAPLWAWVIAWMFLLPITFTVVLLRKENVSNVTKCGIVALAWIIFLAFAMITGEDTSKIDVAKKVDSKVEVSRLENENETNAILVNEYEKLLGKVDNNPFYENEKKIRKFVTEYNELSNIDITSIEWKNNHKIANVKFQAGSGKLNSDAYENSFLLEFEFADGKNKIDSYEKIFRDVIKVFDLTVSDLEIENAFIEARESKVSKIREGISIKYNYIEEQIGYKQGDTYIIEMRFSDY